MSALDRLLNSRPVMAPYSGPDITTLSSNVKTMISRSLDWSQLLSDWDWDQGTDSIVTHVKDQINVRPSLEGYSVTEVLESMLIHQMTKHVKSSDVESVRKVASVISQLRTEGKIELRNVQELRLKVSDPGISWTLHQHELVSIGHQWKYCDADYMESLVMGHWRVGSETAVNIVKAALECWDAGDKRMVALLSRMLRLTCDRMTEDTEDTEEWSLTWVACGHRKWSSLVLTFVLRHGAGSVSLMDCVRSQGDWSVSTQAGLGSLCHGLMSALSVEDCVKIVARTLDRDSVNLRYLLALVAVSCATDHSSGQHWSHMVSGLLSTAMQEEDKDGLIMCLVIMRQVTHVSGGNYSSWFSELTSEDSPQLQSRSECEFLMTVLLSLVPEEPVSVLRSHLSVRPAAVVRQCRDQWDVYRQCARTRLDTGTGSATDMRVAGVTGDTADTVTSYVEQWSNTGKIPPALNEDIMFRKPLYESQLLPGLLSVVMKSDQMEGSRDQLVTALYAKGRVSAAVYHGFKAGQYKPQYSASGCHITVTDSDCSEQNLDTMLSMLDMLGPGDHDQVTQVCGQLSVIVSRLTQPQQSVVTLQHILNIGDNDKERICRKVMDTVLKVGHLHKDVLSLTGCCHSMLLFTFRQLMTAFEPHPQYCDIFKTFVNNGKDVIVVDQDKKKSFLNILCSRYHFINNEAQLKVVESLLTNLLPEQNIRRQYLENRRLFLSGKDHLHNFRSCDIEEFCNILEMELSIGAHGERRHFLTSTMSLFDSLMKNINQGDRVSKIIKRIVDVWTYQDSNNISRTKEDLILKADTILQTLSTSISSQTWYKAYNNVPDKHNDRFVTIWSLIPKLRITQEDVNGLVKDVRIEEKLAVGEAATKLIIQSSDFQKIPNPVVKVSIGYWYSRYRIHRNPSVESQWEAWRQGQDTSDSARVGVVILAEEYLQEGSKVLLDSSNPLIVKLTKFSSQSLESSLSAGPKDWWPGVMSDKLANSCNLVIVFLVTGNIIKPSVSFIIISVLPKLSQLLSNPDLNDWDISILVTNVMKVVKSFPRQQVKQTLAKLGCSLHKDLKALLNSYC